MKDGAGAPRRTFQAKDLKTTGKTALCHPAGCPRSSGRTTMHPCPGWLCHHQTQSHTERLSQVSNLPAPYTEPPGSVPDQSQGKPRFPNAKSPAGAGLEDRGAEAPTVELPKPKLRRSTRRTGSRSRRRTRRCGHSQHQPWDSCPRCCGCRPATWRCRRHPA